jgi:hypothetical protein
VSKPSVTKTKDKNAAGSWHPAHAVELADVMVWWGQPPLRMLTP